ncbi:hypothetical protein [Acinetobacter lanii]|uniref:hypothetical protein n=1 Tax=Acinetobacter lanii TaxID=2715163 RepID=UPI003877CE2B
MMNSVVSNAAQVQEIKASGVVGVFKAIAPRSFEKTFDGIPTHEIVGAMKICISGLTRQQIDLGLNMVRDNGFCPDPAMFRKWCLGIQGFGTEQQRIQDSYKGKHAALASIIRWTNDNSQSITNAEKEAYNRCYEMFNAINYAGNVDRASYLAYEAFKDNYAEVIKEFAENDIKQCVWESDITVGTKAVDEKFKPKPPSFIKPQSEEDKLWIESRSKQLQAEGMSLIKALFQAQKENMERAKGAVA